MTHVRKMRIGARHSRRAARVSTPIGSNDLLIAAHGTLSGIASELLGMEELRNSSVMMSGWVSAATSANRCRLMGPSRPRQPAGFGSVFGGLAAAPTSNGRRGKIAPNRTSTGEPIMAVNVRRGVGEPTT
jgi:hypothetical protein